MPKPITNIQDFIINSDLFKTIEVDDLLLVEYKCLVEDDQSDIWAHANYFAYVMGGEKKWKTPKNEYKVGSGDAIFVKKGANTVYQYFDQPFIVLFIFIPDEFIRNVILKHPDLPLKNHAFQCDEQLFHLSLNNVMDSFFHSLLSYFSKNASLSKNLLRLKMEELVLNILTQPENHLLKQYFINLGKERKVDIREVMNENFHHPLSLNDFARLCARSLSSFRRDFKQIYGTTPNKWLITKRLEYSKFLIENTDQQINEIIDKSGFVNRSHFMKAFKQSYGLSPINYRKEKVPIST